MAIAHGLLTPVKLSDTEFRLAIGREAMDFLGIDMDRAKEVARIEVVPEAWASAYETVMSGRIHELSADEIATLQEGLTDFFSYLNQRQLKIESYVAAQESGSDFFEALRWLA
ncbi:MAG: hypothetical protein P4L46_25455 [Fimbriimonas sp.]|nr:hypothetical protein [Fimbriimonas sp.]